MLRDEFGVGNLSGLHRSGAYPDLCQLSYRLALGLNISRDFLLRADEVIE